mmetsp:Transcript_9601/g.14820  ORF Transcript_9601/g.14820 Transcript_9601/m.14820 type:complete len:487 (-) Transcript_9601:91-1551(-)
MNFAYLTLSLLLSSCSASIRGSFNENHNRHLKHSGSSNDGGAVTVRDGDCEICSRNNKDNKPTSLMIQYSSNGVNSYYQNANKATCTEGTYPSSTTISVDGFGDFDVSDGDTFVLNGHFGAETTFEIEDSDSCMFHTSCSVPLVAGDQIGPFLILGSDEICSSGGEEEDSECVICDESNKVRPEFLTVRYHADGANSKYQNENKASCRSGSYPNQSTITAEGQTFDVSDGEIFSLYPRGDRFDAETDFTWSDSNTECYIHTSCSVPLVVGDRIGPFEILAGNDCEISSEIPSQTPSAAPSMMPSEKPSTQPSGSPSGSPSVLPSFMPSDKPSSMPSSKPSSVPSDIPSQAPSDSCIEAEVRRLAGNKVVVDIAFSYNDKGPVASDWVGLYPCEDENLTPPFSKEPAIWAYTCYNRNCRFEPFANGVRNFTFDDATVPNFGTQGIYNKLEDIIAEKPGCYVALLNRIDGDSPPPYYNICIGNEIELY